MSSGVLQLQWRTPSLQRPSSLSPLVEVVVLLKLHTIRNCSFLHLPFQNLPHAESTRIWCVPNIHAPCSADTLLALRTSSCEPQSAGWYFILLPLAAVRLRHFLGAGMTVYLCCLSFPPVHVPVRALGPRWGASHARFNYGAPQPWPGFILLHVCSVRGIFFFLFYDATHASGHRYKSS